MGLYVRKIDVGFMCKKHILATEAKILRPYITYVDSQTGESFISNDLSISSDAACCGLVNGEFHISTLNDIQYEIYKQFDGECTVDGYVGRTEVLCAHGLINL